MVNIPKLKINFEYEKKKKEKPIKIPKAHTLNLGRVRSIVLLILIGLFIYFSYVLLLANATAYKNKTLQQTVATLNQRINQENAGTTSYNPLVDSYMTQFLKVYYSPSSGDSDARTRQLTQYLASNLTLPSTDKNTDLKLGSSTLNGIFTVDTVKTAQYNLTVEVNKKQSQLTVNIPYQQDNEKLTVTGLPYVANSINSISHVGQARLANTGKTLNSEQTTTKVTKFTKQFAQKYVSSPTKDMAFLMTDPVGLDGAVDFVSLDDSSIKVAGTSKRPIVTATMTVKVHDSDITQVQTIRLYLKQQASTYFVTKFIQA
ncbi:conjugal transfer protein [Leuconostoc citreum]|uniref:conjugal transfer protein n=1 Tax=Leuconostoc citreum TaxID=33964 RepID=UPI001888B3DF|nr:conjugal transfer protein [Leuconostoc citreum]MCJ2168077.1 conjugal transfer protein [Leuconostoc citreum]MCT3057349.1 conjugal transfer protein [Leuconostoc citreum]MCT3059517.1 conjugal transfer protein [Leuconostoc citreum]MCT3061231.1 conjugal transfer protein [Leuconostoc citreum]MCT3071333.1 conjugal transfer protein [Leuconostoc citreum]